MSICILIVALAPLIKPDPLVGGEHKVRLLDLVRFENHDS